MRVTCSYNRENGCIIRGAHKGRGPQALVALYGPLTDTWSKQEPLSMDYCTSPQKQSIHRATGSKTGGR